MAGQEKSARSANAAAHMRLKGIYHGVRRSRPYPNSGGLTMVNKPGSARYQRLVASRQKGRT